MKKLLITLISAAAIMFGCKGKTVEISGTLINPISGKYIYLEELLPSELKRIDSALIGADGTFNFKKRVSTPSFYILQLANNNSLIMLLEPGDNIIMNAFFDSLSYPSALAGSKSTALMIEYDNQLRNSAKKLRSLNEIYVENIDNPMLDIIFESLDSLSKVYMDEINTYTKNYIDENTGSLVSLMALFQQVAPNLYVMEPTEDFEYFVKVDNALSKKYPDNMFVKTLHEQILDMTDIIENGTFNLNNDDAINNKEVPDISLPTPNGDIVKLSSTRGSVVLLDVWAAWCGPCRMENPNLVKVYDKYHAKGFQIYQVSLDRTKDAWVRGINEDKLDRWIHVSDLKYWNSSVVRQYGIQAIPYNLLLDQNGRVIAANLRGEALERKLAEIFPQ